MEKLTIFEETGNVIFYEKQKWMRNSLKKNLRHLKTIPRM